MMIFNTSMQIQIDYVYSSIKWPILTTHLLSPDLGTPEWLHRPFASTRHASPYERKIPQTPSEDTAAASVCTPDRVHSAVLLYYVCMARTHLPESHLTTLLEYIQYYYSISPWNESIIILPYRIGQNSPHNSDSDSGVTSQWETWPKVKMRSISSVDWIGMNDKPPPISVSPSPCVSCLAGNVTMEYPNGIRRIADGARQIAEDIPYTVGYLQVYKIRILQYTIVFLSIVWAASEQQPSQLWCWAEPEYCVLYNVYNMWTQQFVNTSTHQHSNRTEHFKGWWKIIRWSPS